MLTDAAVRHWLDIRDAANADIEWTKGQRELAERRRIVQSEIVDFTSRFLAGAIDAETLRGTFDSKTRVEWGGFGLKGMSYSMFLNKLLKYLGGSDELAARLRETLALPATREDGYTRLRSFHDWLNGLIATGLITRKSVQPARAPSFVSAFWHLQATEQWPVYYESARSVLERQQLIDPPDDVVDAYFEFRDRFNELKDRLGISSWALEQLCRRVGALPATEAPPPAQLRPSVAPVAETESQEEVAGHAHVQWLLATVGQKLGCQVWIAANDRSKKWKGTTLGSLSLKTLPRLGLGDDITRRVGYLDVLWLKGSKVIAAFEVEHTTQIYSGLLRLSDLIAAAPNLNFQLYIVAPATRIEAVAAELRRPTFQYLGLHKRCGFFSEEVLLREQESMMRWASDAAVIDKLAQYVDDVESD